MRWSMWPVSITVHVVLVTAALIVPLTAGVAPPTPAPLHPLTVASIKAIPVPPEVVASAPAARSTRALPSVIAADTIAPPREIPPQPPGPAMPNMPIGTGALDAGAIGGITGTAPVPPPPAMEPAPPAPKMFHVGQGVREPRRIAGGPPQYPAIAQRARVQGTVILEAVINERGTIERLRVLKSQPLLDAAAVSAVREWRYTPTLLNGVPVSVLMTITINFTLQN